MKTSFLVSRGEKNRMRRALTRARCASRTHGALRARIFPPTPFFGQILDPPLYTSPLARPSRLPPLTRYARYATEYDHHT